MNKLTFLACLFILWSNFSFSQDYKGAFAIINDPDGYTNVRNQSKKIIDRITDFEIIAINDFCSPVENYKCVDYGWKAKDSFTRFGWGEKGYDQAKEKSGLIHSSRIKYLSDLPQLTKTIVDKNKIVFENQNIKFEIITGKFDATSYIVTEDKIDDYPIWGYDGYCLCDTNAVDIKSINYSFGEEKYSFPKKALIGYLAPNHEYMYVAKAADNIYYLIMSNGDGAGGYELVYTIKDKILISAIAYRNF